MRIDLHPNDLTVPHPASQDCLDYAIELGRIRAGIQSRNRHFAALVSKAAPESMESIKYRAALAALQKCGGSGKAAAAMLQMSRAAFYQLLKRGGVGVQERRKIVPAIFKVACAVGLLMLSVFQASASSLIPLPAAVAVPTNRFTSYTFSWESTPLAAGYKLYTGTNSGTYSNIYNVSNTLTATLTNFLAGQRYYVAATAYDTNGNESGFSNEIFVPPPRTNVVIVTVTKRSSLTGAATVLWSQAYTNPPGDIALFETTIKQTNELVRVLRLNTSTLQIANTNQ